MYNLLAALDARHITFTETFTREQLETLADHLSKAFGEDEALLRALITIADTMLIARVQIEHGAELKVASAERQQHMRAVHESAARLRDLLFVQRPFDGVDWTAVETVLGGEAATTLPKVNWPAFLRELVGVITLAAIDVEDAARQPKPGRGRPALAWRDDLISAIYALYPAHTAPGADSHFWRTIEMLLEWLPPSQRDAETAEVENLQQVIKAALRRRPEPPAHLRLTRSEIPQD